MNNNIVDFGAKRREKQLDSMLPGDVARIVTVNSEGAEVTLAITEGSEPPPPMAEGFAIHLGPLNRHSTTVYMKDGTTFDISHEDFQEWARRRGVQL